MNIKQLDKLEKIAVLKKTTVQELIDRAINDLIETETKKIRSEVWDRQFNHYLYVK